MEVVVKSGMSRDEVGSSSESRSVCLELFEVFEGLFMLGTVQVAHGGFSVCVCRFYPVDFVLV